MRKHRSSTPKRQRRQVLPGCLPMPPGTVGTRLAGQRLLPSLAAFRLLLAPLRLEFLRVHLLIDNGV